MHALITTNNRSLITEVQKAFWNTTITVTFVETVYEAAQFLKSKGVDVVMLDLSVQHAMEFLKDMKSHVRFSHIPVVVLLDEPDPEQIKPALEAGADRWLTTAFIRTRLPSVIKSFADTTTSSS